MSENPNFDSHSDLWAAYQAINEGDDDEEYVVSTEKLDYPTQGFKMTEIPMDSDSDGEDEEGKNYESHDTESIKAIRSPHEIPTSQILPEQLGDIPESIPSDCKIVPCCVVISKVNELCICDAIGTPVAPSSLLVTEEREPVTRVIEIFGNVENPKYILHGDFPIGMRLFVALNDAFLISEDERNRIETTFKGTDSSNKYDEPNERPDEDEDGAVDSDDDEIEIGYQR